MPELRIPTHSEITFMIFSFLVPLTHGVIKYRVGCVVALEELRVSIEYYTAILLLVTDTFFFTLAVVTPCACMCVDVRMCVCVC